MQGFLPKVLNINSESDPREYPPTVVLAEMLSFCPLTGGLGVMVTVLIFPWSDDFAANTDKIRLLKNTLH